MHQSKHTKADLIQPENPCTAEVQLAKEKDVRDGGILIGCKSKAGNQKLKAIVQEKLSDSYVIHLNIGVTMLSLNWRGITEDLKQRLIISVDI
ncbi:unnamed protein product [Acanthoscelides obtectus]|uniref:Uncharacterized protein n=1 Tax=Acanthoscelides obtectus TaxID=200917 RepID=A0A9P0MDZ5_ACAOB|nr:unnamed protein product [Acanthoscelides obtectus]CAK1625980.1 hypothetical protein AOBTE_LOCUS3518 [Acanthoscelides obtectus]